MEGNTLLTSLDEYSKHSMSKNVIKLKSEHFLVMIRLKRGEQAVVVQVA
jgi:hypothetical protein